jgi:hypothetical protein
MSIYKLLLFIPLLAFGFLHAQSVEYRQIKQLVEQKCLSCHRTNGYAPFSLEKKDDWMKRKKFISYVIQQNIMPPWKANEHYRSFSNSKALNKHEKELLLKWMEADMPGFDAQLIQPAVSAQGSQVSRKPDLIVRMPKPFTIPGNNKNTYICYKIPYEIDQDTFVSGIEFIPGNKAVVHHASYQIIAVAPDVNVHEGPDYFVYDADTLNRVRDDHDYAYFKLIGEGNQLPIELYHNGWLPGTSAQIYPEKMGFYLPKKGVILIRNFHYSPSPVAQLDQSSFYLYFAASAPQRKIGFAAFKPKNPTPDGKWLIHANDSQFKSHINVKFHNDVSLLAINPHMHQLGKNFLAYAVTTTQDTIKLIHIPEWDYNWQEFYRFKTLIKIPAGSVLHAEAEYDNSFKNHENPFSPPKDILFEWGMNEDSEMMRLVLLYLPYANGDDTVSLE